MTENQLKTAHAAVDATGAAMSKLHPAAQVVLALMFGGALIGAPLYSAASNLFQIGPRMSRIEDNVAEVVQRDSIRAIEILRLRADAINNRLELSDMNVQFAHITCRIDRVLEPAACDAIRDKVQEILRRSASNASR
jgi:hypothetical protein